MGGGGHVFNGKHFIGMVKKSIITIGLVSVFAGVLAMGYFIVERVALKKAVAENIQSLNLDDLYTLDSLQFRLKETSPVVLIFFNSGCEHCQYELSEIKKNLSSFSGTQLLFLSSENITSIKSAAEKYIGEIPSNINFLKINREDVFEKFGALSVPHIFVYSAEKKLVKEFKGETKVEAIIQHLPK
ncbi:MAG: peroxiredoxin family protein [Bacteroidota bacterium]